MTVAQLTIERLTSGAATHGFRWMTFPLYRAELASRFAHDTIAIGARLGIEPIGLLVADVASGTARIVSIVVRPRFRRLGVARRMLATLEDTLRVRRIDTIVAGAADDAWGEGLAPLFLHAGFTTLRAAGLCIELENQGLAPLFEHRRRDLPRALSAVPWTHVTPAQREDVLRRQAASPWYPESLSPFRHEIDIVPETSLALIARDTIAGWAIGHLVAADVIHYATIFVREDLRNLGAGAGLFFAALRRHCTTEATRRLRGRFCVRDESTRMAQMMERRIRPFASSWAPYLETTKRVAHARF